jgi:hypothetical protein
MAQTLTFDTWKRILQIDCIAHGKEREYNALGEAALNVLYESGLDPSVKAISSG